MLDWSCVKFLATSQSVDHAPHLNVLEDSWLTKKLGCFRPSGDEKKLFKERILEASRFNVGRSCQLSISYH